MVIMTSFVRFLANEKSTHFDFVHVLFLLRFCFGIKQVYIYQFPMARGHQKFQSQQKNAQKMEKLKKAQGHDSKSSAQKALVFTCTVCKSQMPDPKTYKQHFESKHPKSPLPPELASES
ncbi:hypothetical protein OS493_034496 [Desmophyllum pertusum]|uniref:Small EDRK-rich factor-like N-terminal domain-containing protein n=1 Tax=Desmophyllum pertusum TaxID=174260 RepID=A0A9W9YV89_9CNID|nr:hypothetical protein OS493_034496 [Desmophyllum pertusum]